MVQLRRLHSASVILAVAAVYFVAAKIGLNLAFVNASATAVWPPTGIALAALLVLGHRVWPGVLLGAFLANITTAGGVTTSSAIAAGNTLEGLLGAFLVRRYASGTRVFEKPHDIFRFAIFAGVLATMVSATVGVTSLVLGGLAPGSEYLAIWLTWWMGDASGALIVAPLLILWSREPEISWDAERFLEVSALYLTLLVVGLFVFGGLSPWESRHYPLQYLCFPPLLWAAFRFRPRESATAIMLLSAVAIAGTLRGLGPFAAHSPNQSLPLLQGFLAVISVMNLAVTAAVEERRRSEASARRLTDELERRVDDRTEQLWLVNRELSSQMRRRSRAQKRLEKSETRLREAQRAARMGSWEWDIESNTLWWSEELYEIYGVSPEEFRASYEGFLELVHPDDRERAHRVVSAALEEKRPFTFEHRIVRPDGSVRVLLGQGDVLTDRHGRAVRLAGTGQDITEHKRMEEEREALYREQIARREAEEANRLKDEFLATLSHELRTPLNAIVGWASLLREERLDPATTARAVETINRNVRIQSHLISDILDISRMSMGHLDIKTQPVMLPAVIESALDTMRPAAHAKNVVLRSTLASLPAPVMGDPDRLQQVVWNLLSNAIKFAPEGRSVLISLTEKGGSACLTVEDDGPGIDPGFLPYVFDRFRQRDSSGTRRHGGLGLGLAIVRRLVELHRGTVSAANREDGPGARFTVTLPLADPSCMEPARPSAASAVADPGSAGMPAETNALAETRILLVEDDPDSRELVAMLLSRYGAEVATVHSCNEALAAIAEQPPDILISDIAMPGESGYDLIAKVRSLPRDRGGSIPAVALTAYAGADDVQRTLRAGYQAHVSKPVELHELLKIMRELVDGNRGAP